MAVKLLFNDLPTFLDSSGNPASGYKLHFFAAGSSTYQNVYQDSGGLSVHANPIVLNSRGQPAAAVWGTTGLTYKMILASPTDTSPPVTAIETVDNISPINDTSVTIDQWVGSLMTPTYVSATSFTLSGDQTSTFHVGRRLKTTNSGGTVYSTITASSFGALTTVTVVNDSGTLDSGLSAVSYSLISKVGDSVPRGVFPTMPNVAGFIGGFTYSNNVSDATNDIDIAAGRASDSTGADILTGSALTKQSDANWAVGTNAGMLDTGAVGNSDYYLWVIKRVDTQVVDYLCSLSSTAPTMPANYTLKRLIGWFKRTGGTIVAFHTYETEGGGIEMSWDVPTLDVSLLNTLTTARRTDAVKVPLNFTTIAHLNVFVFDATAPSIVWVCCPDQTDAAPSASVAPLTNITSVTAKEGAAQMQIRTSSTGTVASRANLATVDEYRMSTMGFRWARRN